jgi:hypothetical protein
MNMGLGFRYTLDVNDYNQFNIAFDVNKLLVPTPVPQYLTDKDGRVLTNPDGSPKKNPDFDKDNNGVADYREKSVPAAIFTSFSDAPGGFKEEMKEFIIGAGVEYWYDQLFAVRAGYFYESPDKGKRRFLSLGIGLRYNVFGIDFAYLVPTTSQRHPLDNTMRFSLLFSFEKSKSKQEATPVEPPMN